MSRSRMLQAAALAVVLVAAGALRFASLDRFIASDEVRWTCRSINFAAALQRHDFEATFQVGHPGVITMWVGSLALPRDKIGDWWELARTTDGGTDLSKLDDVGMEGTFQTLAPVLFGARRGVAAATLLLLALVYAVARAAGARPLAALTGVGLLAFDPFLLAHSRVLHLDALTALLSLLAVTAVVAGDRTEGRRRLLWRVGAGGVAGLAVIEKSSALVLIPFVAGWMLYGVLRRRGALGRAMRDMAAWSAGAVAAGVAFWPAMWVSPLGTPMRVLAKAAEEGGVPHPGGNFFLGRPVDDPGPLFYPVATLFRLTPVGLLSAAGLAALLVMWIRRGRGRPVTAEGAGPESADGSSPVLVDGPSPVPAGRDPETNLILALAIWGALFAAVLTLGPKKFDRYGLPSFVALELAGGVATVLLAERRRVVGGPRTAPAVAAGLVALQAVIAVRSLPYPLAYYNAALGGAKVAQHVILVGWGEGYDLAADWLNGLPNAGTLEVSVPGVSNFAPLFVGRTRSAPGYRTGRTDYAVLYVSKVQRRRNENLLEEFHEAESLEPAYVGRIAGIPYVWIYGNPTVAPLEDALGDRLRPGDVIVADGESAFARRYAGPSPLVKSWGHWGVAEMKDAVEQDFPVDWRRAWIVRYPEHDPEAAVDGVAAFGRARPPEKILDGQIELTLVERQAPFGEASP